MVATILLLIAFQVYWMRKLYGEEKENFKKTSDVVFRDAMYRLQVQRFSGDTMALRAGMSDNLFMADFISSVEKIKGDSLKQKLVISMDTHTEKMVSSDSVHTNKKEKDTIVYVSTKNDGIPPPVFQELVSRNKNLGDTIPVKTVDSMYRILLAKERINVDFTVIKTNPTLLTTDSGTKRFTVKLNEQMGAFSTKRVPVGLMSPVKNRAHQTYRHPFG